ncbi:Clavaminate synthase-like protein [Mytilinidion resinicola]|uniref:Clavaminate synthase-like protein n=1 Tax=Mytilinidion resinicola TaxID=574789 RepID=A0A6A6YQ84_9PEZI|nr:Clavaminate synthase-like protein [Mytilinidion resinicola]KAF2810688.1 Clavaminate synthase-like protein [Mytilinidion resinicola]
MAPHAEEPFLDLSGYTPSSETIAELKRKLRICHARSFPTASWVTPETHLVDSHEIVRAEEYPILQLSLEDLRELEDAFSFFNSTALPLNQLQAEHFPLPTLSRRIHQHRVLLPTTQPYFIIRGLKPQWFSKYKNIVIFTGLASHVGTKRALAPGDPNVLHHVTNMKSSGENEKETYRGPANRSTALPFHTDYGSILSFYVLSKAASGGDIYLADIDDISRQIAASRPDVLSTLRQSFLNINAKEEGACDERPLLFTLPSGRIAVQASRSRLFGTTCRPRPKSLPPLSQHQVEAINALHAAGQAVAKRLELRSGDMLFFNNLKMMHARDAFIDGNEDENTSQRYLLRLILKDDRADAPWEIPPQLATTWDELYNHPDEDEAFAIHPELFSYKAAH